MTEAGFAVTRVLLVMLPLSFGGVPDAMSALPPHLQFL